MSMNRSEAELLIIQTKDTDDFFSIIEQNRIAKKIRPIQLIVHFGQFQDFHPSKKRIQDGTLQAICDALKSGYCPKNLTLNLSINNLTKEDMPLIADALTSDNCPENLELMFSGNKLRNEGAAILATALASGLCKPGLCLDLRNNRLTSLVAFTKALESGNCPTNLTLDMLFQNDFDRKGIESIMTAIKQGHTPPGFKFSTHACTSVIAYSIDLLRQIDWSLKDKEDQVKKRHFLANITKVRASDQWHLSLPTTRAKKALEAKAVEIKPSNGPKS